MANSLSDALRNYIEAKEELVGKPNDQSLLNTKETMAGVIAAASVVSVTTSKELIAALDCANPENISYDGPNSHKDIRKISRLLRTYGVESIKNVVAAEREDRFDMNL